MSQVTISCIDSGKKFPITVSMDNKQFSLNDCRNCINFIKNSQTIKIISESKSSNYTQDFETEKI